jgi:predicted Rossmann-fold nucleotide-binding protein
MPQATPFDHSPDEIESRAELEHHLRSGSLAGLTVQGLRLDQDWPAALDTASVAGTLFVGCRLPSTEICADLIRRGASIVPDFPGLPYSVQPSRLYLPEDLVAGVTAEDCSGMYDAVVYRHFLAHGGALPPVREALTQRMHDHGIDDALTDILAEWHNADGGPVVGIMGGHAALRGSAGYRAAAAIGQGLARSGCLVVTGGGPGVMEAANLGAFFADDSAEALTGAIDRLATAARFRDTVPYTMVALAVREAVTSRKTAAAGDLGWGRSGGLSVPTWLYGHEPANIFAARIAKYFSNAIREDTILRMARGGIIFAPGEAGTVQEVFQAATKAFYGTDGPSGPFVFIDRAYWTETLPVSALLAPVLGRSPHGDLTGLIQITDDPDEAIKIILGYREQRLAAPSPSLHPLPAIEM